MPYQHVILWRLLWDQEAKEHGAYIAGACIGASFHLLNSTHLSQHAEHHSNAANIHPFSKTFLPYTNTPTPTYIMSST
ncbi:hypothetical protein L208DRAFT_1415209 [Tricholoma matsutake]|nr:hypothetical protein L208DRAFT_1415209 [Tricholoma matsutake 945]